MEVYGINENIGLCIIKSIHIGYNAAFGYFLLKYLKFAFPTPFALFL